MRGGGGGGWEMHVKSLSKRRLGTTRTRTRDPEAKCLPLDHNATLVVIECLLA